MVDELPTPTRNMLELCRGTEAEAQYIGVARTPGPAWTGPRGLISRNGANESCEGVRDIDMLELN